jgi:hypothetical protein
MILDFEHILTDLENNPIVDELGKVASLKTVIAKALVTDTQKAEDKLKRFDLYIKLKLSEFKAELTAEEAALLKEVSAIYPTLVYGQLVAWIEGKKITSV